MNLILLEREDVDDLGRATLHGPRARHALDVIGAEPGRRLRVGIIDGPLGHAEVVELGEVEPEAPTLSLLCAFRGETPARPADVLLLAMPRPVVLGRVIEQATAVGFGDIVVFRSWRVDKAHLRSKAIGPAALRHRALIGLAQARRTRVPRFRVFELFKPFVEDELDALVPPDNRYIAHPTAPDPVGERPPDAGPMTLAIGPERGFTDYEVEMLTARGFAPVRAGPHPLRVETAVVALHARLDQLRDSH